MIKLLDGREVELRLGFKYTKRRKLEKAGLITRPISRSPIDRRWPEHEVEIIAAALLAGQSDDEIKLLVQQLHAERVGLLDAVRKAA